MYTKTHIYPYFYPPCSVLITMYSRKYLHHLEPTKYPTYITWSQQNTLLISPGANKISYFKYLPSPGANKISYLHCPIRRYWPLTPGATFQARLLGNQERVPIPNDTYAFGKLSARRFQPPRLFGAVATIPTVEMIDHGKSARRAVWYTPSCTALRRGIPGGNQTPRQLDPKTMYPPTLIRHLLILTTHARPRRWYDISWSWLLMRAPETASTGHTRRITAPSPSFSGWDEWIGTTMKFCHSKVCFVSSGSSWLAG